MAVKSNMLSLRLSEQMDNWLENQSQLLGMTKSEVVRFWLQTSMLTFEKSADIASKVAREQIKGQMNTDQLVV